MREYISLVIISFLLFCNFVFANEWKQKNDSSKSYTNEIVLQNLYDNLKFEKWINYWKSEIPEISNFHIEKVVYVKKSNPTKANVNYWLQARSFRNITLNFSPRKNFIIDLYAHVDFKSNNDTIYVDGGDIDPYFEILDREDSLQYYFTLGPQVFFDENVWTSDSTYYILGFNLSPNADKEKAHSNMMILQWNINREIVTIYFSRNYPFKNRIMNFLTYMRYLYPEFKYSQ